MNLSQCSQDHTPEVIFAFRANSTMAQRNSMRTKTWLFEKTPFPLKFGQNDCGAKACSRPQRQFEPRINVIWNVEITDNILLSLCDFSALIYHVLQYCLVSMRTISAFCTQTHMHARLTWDPREVVTHSKNVREHLLWVLPFGHMPYYMGFGIPW